MAQLRSTLSFYCSVFHEHSFFPRCGSSGDNDHRYNVCDYALIAARLQDATDLDTVESDGFIIIFNRYVGFLFVLVVILNKKQNDMSVSLLPRDVDWCDYETFLLLLQDVDVYRNIILMFEFWSQLII